VSPTRFDLELHYSRPCSIGSGKDFPFSAHGRKRVGGAAASAILLPTNCRRGESPY
jgi:hypothetical protein